MESFMSPSPSVSAAEEFAAVSLGEVERVLARKLKEIQAPGEAPVLQARMSNLVIYCDRLELASRIAEIIPAVVALHPARVLLLIGTEESGHGQLEVSVRVRARRLAGHRPICTEQITLRAHWQAVRHLPFAVRELLIGDLPTNLWWACPSPPPLAGPLLYDLAEYAEQIVYDSHGWTDPHRGVAATAAWLAKFERQRGHGRWRTAADLNWRRLKYWRRLLAQALDPSAAPGALESISDVLVEHGPHAVTQAWELVGWLAARLGWRVQTGHVEPGVELSWDVETPRGNLRLRIHRLPEGPADIHHVRVACLLDGKPTVLNMVVDDESRLAVKPEEAGATPRTLTIQPQTVAGMVGRQLSDREPDPVFHDSMAVAHVFAQSILS
jgi:glucose-6-phosphate dehydrogenase assembly protein OpcA